MPDADSDARELTREQVLRMFDLHVEVLRANRELDRAFPPYTGEQFAAIRDGAERLRDRAEELRALFDDDGLAWCGGRHPGACHVPDSTGVCELSTSVTPPAEKDPATLTDKEIELREWLRAQPGGAERWMVIKAGFRRSYDMGVNHGWGLGAKHMRAVLTRVLPPEVGQP